MSKKLKTYIETGFFPELLSMTEANYYLFGDLKTEKIRVLIREGLILTHDNKIIKKTIDKYLNYLIKEAV